MSDALKDQIINQLDGLSEDEQRRILEFVRSVAAPTPEGVSGRSLLHFTGLFEVEDAHRMAEAVEEGCERVDPDEW